MVKLVNFTQNMSSPSDEIVKKYIEEIANVLDTRSKKNKLKRDVIAMCEILLSLVKEHGVPKKVKQHFEDIYWSLKLHLVFLLGTEDANLEKLEELRELLGLPSDQLPQRDQAIDPGSKLLEIFSEISEETKGPKGSEDHADGVMAQAQVWLKTLSSHNIFKPKVMALVYHNGNFFVGSSIAVGHYLRPLCLFNRICNFKYSLKKAVVYFQPLQTEDNIDWASVAFSDKDYKTYKAPCQLCTAMFQNLSGFPTETEREGKFLAACAEYAPINQHLSDAEDDLWVDLALRKYRDQQCAKLFQDFKKIWEKCRKAWDDKSSDVGRYSELYNKHVKEKIHIFGIKPKQNRSLKNHVEEVKVVAVLTVLFFTVFVPFLSILCLCRRLLVAEEQGSSR